MITIVPADFDNPELHRFLSDHLADMAPTAPEESRHALDIESLRVPNVSLWTATLDGAVVGTAALADITPGHGELKSMRTDPAHRGQGIASTLLDHIIEQALSRGTERISLETGSMDFFAPARRLYSAHGFVECQPFADYREDPNSVFMTLSLKNAR